MLPAIMSANILQELEQLQCMVVVVDCLPADQHEELRRLVFSKFGAACVTPHLNVLESFGFLEFTKHEVRQLPWRELIVI